MSLNVIVTGQSNSVGSDCTNIAIINSSGCTVMGGLSNVTLINSSGVIISESNKVYIRNSDVTDSIAQPDEPWIDNTFNAADYTSSSGTWVVDSGDVLNNRYKIVGKTLYWNVYLVSTTITGTPSQLFVALPSGLSIGSNFNSLQVSKYADSLLINEYAILRALATESFVTVARTSGSFGASANLTAITFTIILELD